MATEHFDGHTFVAFTDISGFKSMVRGDRESAIHALDEFYTRG
jgi:hypothetical protein